MRPDMFHRPMSFAAFLLAVSIAPGAMADAGLSTQKIKAVRYLATVGCECSAESDKVRDSLLAALDDCSEEVRCEAALALCRSAGNPCSQCNGHSCCGPEVMDKLAKMAEGRDKNGCWCEPSGHVRAAARRALDVCRRARRQGREVFPAPRLEVTPTPGPEVAPTPSPDEQVMGPDEPSLTNLAAAAPSPDTSSLWTTPSPTGTTLGMIGDFLGSTGRTATISGENFDLPAPGIRGLKIAEKNSTLPQDRFLVNYSYFHNAMADSGRSLDVNRFVFGMEKTFLDGLSSIEFRIPFASTLNSTQRTDLAEYTGVELGNIGLLLKGLLSRGNGYALGGGLAIVFPTGDDTQLFRTDSFGDSDFATPDGLVKIMHVNNEAYHLMPWIGLRLDPDERLFIESFLQFDFAVNENSVFGQFDGPQGEFGTLPGIGQVYDQTVMFTDISIGYWLYRDRCGPRRLKGVVPKLELHYTTSLQDADVLEGQNGIDQVTSRLGRFDHLNLTAGAHFVFRRGGTITPAVVAPLRTGDDRQFDYELQVQINVPY